MAGLLDARAVGPDVAERWLRGSVALVWLAAGVLVLHPHSRNVGAEFLRPLGLGAGLVWVIATVHVALGAVVAARPWGPGLAAVQVGLVAGLTLLLGATHPDLLVHPLGMLSKNLPLVAVIGAAWLLPREGWSHRTIWLLRSGMAVIWITEGVFPKIVFQQESELLVAQRYALDVITPSLFLAVLGAAQAASGVLALVLRGSLLRAVLGLQAASLIVLPLLVAWDDAWPWVHPLAPLIKVAPILVGTSLLAWRGVEAE